MSKPEMSIKVTFDRLPEIMTKLPTQAKQITQVAVFNTEALWKAGAPVDTGRYKNSIQGKMTGPASGEVASDVEYGPHLEYGTAHMAPRPSLTPALEVTAKEYHDNMSELAKHL